MKRLTLVLFLILSTRAALAEEKKITANELKDTIANIPIKISNF